MVPQRGFRYYPVLAALMTLHSSLDDRAIRVFVSSTFRDMHEERELLVKHIFPKLRQLCGERGVTFTDVDLRWGITEEQGGEVLSICLAEIERCRPFFIGMLGDRYGWVPRTLDAEAVAQHPWMTEHQPCSITELEILHGVLNNPAMAGRAFFYFRDSSYLDRVPALQRAEYVEAIPWVSERLARLKDRIREHDLPVRPYAAPEQLGELVLRDLTSAIDHEYPPDARPDPLDREAAEHASFARSRARVYIGRQEYFDRLDRHVEGDGPPLVILGESGSGKSALLANWSARRVRLHERDLLVLHFIGATNAGANWVMMLRRILGELKRGLGLTDAVPERPADVRSAVARWFEAAGARAAPAGRRVVLVIDALNQLEDRDGAPDLLWLPAELPANVRLVLSTLPGRSLDEISRRASPTLTIQPLTGDERKELITEYLAQYSKRLSPARAARIAESPQASNPLYLRALLEELRVFGIHERLDQRVDHYLASPTIPALYQRILQRWEEDYERGRPGLVRDALSCLWAARRGLSEAELLGLLGSPGESLPHVHWAPLYLAAESVLVRREGLLGLFHDHFRQAVRELYVPARSDQKDAHGRLAAHFRSLERHSARRAQELPWQLMHAGEWEALFTVLGQQGGSDTSFNAIWEYNRYDLPLYWRQIERHSSLRAVDAYQDVVGMAPGLVKFFHGQLFLRVSEVLSDLGYREEAAAIWGRVLEHGESQGDDLATTYANLGAMQAEQGRYDEAERVLAKAEELLRASGQEARLAPVFMNQALVQKARGDPRAAMQLLGQALGLCRSQGDTKALQHCLMSQARILEGAGRWDDVRNVRREEEPLCRMLGDNEALLECLWAQAREAHHLQRLDDAVELYRRAAALADELDTEGQAMAITINFAQVLEHRGDLLEALAHYENAERRAARRQASGDRAHCLLRSGALRERLGEAQKAAELFKQAEDAARGAQASPALVIEALYRQACQAARAQDLNSAAARYREAEALCRSAGLNEWLDRCLEGRGRLLLNAGDVHLALTVYRERHGLCRQRNDTNGLLGVTLVLGALHRAGGRLDLALTAFRAAEQLARQLDANGPLFLAELRQLQILPAEAEDLRPQRQALLLSLNTGAEALARQGGHVQCLRMLEEWKALCVRRNDLAQLAECEALISRIRSVGMH